MQQLSLLPEPGELPSVETMQAAFLGRDRQFDGVFYTAVKTTGIFCRPTCPARKPKPANVEFYASAHAALLAGYRPCRRCHPLESTGEAPDWLRPLLERIEGEPGRKWKDRDLRAMGLQPERVRRWFKKHHGITFQAYSRARRLGEALEQISFGDSIPGAALDSGYESLSGFNAAVKKMSGGSASAASARRPVVMTRIPTPLGPMVAGATDEALVLLEFADRPMLPTQFDRVGRLFNALIVPGENAIIQSIASELESYFAGRSVRFETPILDTGTPFQEVVWTALRGIPPGQTWSYQQLAEFIGKPAAVRAVGRANGDNRMAIVIPCHRVVGKNGQLTGYGGGLWRKKRLLEIERASGTSNP